ncbi:MAG: ATP-binding protein, partial [Saprospiraceae bacterium]
MELIGRKEERKILHHCLQSTESKLVAVFGRRRVGKTFLIRNHFKDHMQFEISGLHGGDMEDQLNHFVDTLNKHGLYISNIAKPTSWRSAFSMLSLLIDGMRDKKKKVIFIDELPWFDTPKSKFLMAFENFWNSYCSHRKDIVMVICGSAASWMIKKILGNKGGLHNRVSE